MLFHKNMRKLQKHYLCLVQIQIYQIIMDKCHCTEPLNVRINLKIFHFIFKSIVLQEKSDNRNENRNLMKYLRFMIVKNNR